MAPSISLRARDTSLTGARFVVLAGPTALAFFTGGYFAGPRAWAGAIEWILFAIALVASKRPFPRARSGRVAVAGLMLLAAWTLISTAWAPIAGDAYASGQIAFLYAGGLLAAAALLRAPAVRRLVEPAVAFGALIVIGYGESDRLLPGLLHFSRSVSAEGRLEQPLTYWNAMGEVAALGLVVVIRIAGDANRSIRLRLAAAAAAAPLGMGLYLSFSRGALFAAAAGLVALVVLAPQRAQLQSMVLGVAAAVLASLAATPFGGVTKLGGSLATREGQGAVVLVALAVIAIAAALGQRALIARAPGGEVQPVRLPRHAGWIALAVICAGFALAVLVGAKESSGTAPGAGAARYTTLQSNRYAYWRVALRAFADEPLRGVGAGGWAVWWLRYRTVAEGAQDAHSLPLQTAAELGLVGVALLLAFLGGAGYAARAAHRVAPGVAAGPIAGMVVWLAHSPLDWDWQMPAVTLIAVVLAGAVLGLADVAGSIPRVDRP